MPLLIDHQARQQPRAMGTMKLVADYLERVQCFRQLAEIETNLEVRERLLEQAETYLKLAQNRAKNLGQPLPEGHSGD